jgi:hypothetical protein
MSLESRVTDESGHYVESDSLLSTAHDFWQEISLIWTEIQVWCSLLETCRASDLVP